MSATLFTLNGTTVALNCSTDQAAKLLPLFYRALTVRNDFDYSGPRSIRAWVIQGEAEISLSVVSQVPVSEETWTSMKAAASEGGSK